METKEPKFTRAILHDLKRLSNILKDKYIAPENKIKELIRIVDNAVVREMNSKRGNSVKIKGPL